MGRIGADELAAHAIALQIASVCFMVPFGLGQAVTVRVGRAFGAQDREGVTRAGWTAFALGVGFMGFTALLMLIAPHLLISAFLDMNDPKNLPVIGYAASFLMLAAFFQLADGAQAVGSGMLRGLQDTRVPMVYAAIGYWGIGLPLGVWLAFGAGFRGVGIWIGLATGLGVVAGADAVALAAARSIGPRGAAAAGSVRRIGQSRALLKRCNRTTSRLLATVFRL